MYDITIIGAGITGALIARQLSKYNLKVLVLERNNDVARGATSANSAIVHSGHDPKPDTLKCKYNVLGSRMYPDLCKELKVSYKQIGAFVVATSDEEKAIINKLIDQCENREIPYEILNRNEALKQEPNLADDVIEALSLPTTAIVSPWEVCIAALEEAMLNQVELRLNYEVKSIKQKRHSFIINKDIETSLIINCAGAHCDDIISMLRKSPYKVETNKGEYYVLDHTDKLVNHVIYPVPSSKGKGVLVIPTIHNNILLGPNSEFELNKDDVSTGTGLDYVKKQVAKTVKNVPYNRMIKNFAGLRAHIDLDDFYIKEDDKIKNFIHVAGIESPGLTSAPAIAKEVVENIVLPKFEYSEKEMYVRRKAFIKMNEMTFEEKARLIEHNPDFGKIVCRCEQISLGEIKDVIHRNCGATTISGVKLRCRPGMGKCQGSFCEPEVFKILMEELDMDKEDVKLSNLSSTISIADPKESL